MWPISQLKESDWVLRNDILSLMVKGEVAISSLRLYKAQWP